MKRYNPKKFSNEENGKFDRMNKIYKINRLGQTFLIMEELSAIIACDSSSVFSRNGRLL